jgi:hypothetical protein
MSSTSPISQSAASACALIWFGSVTRIGVVGLHRPTTDDPAFKALSPADASPIYRRMIESVTNYLDEMETPKPMIDAMIATGSAEMRWVDSDKDGLENPPSIAEWKAASCGSVTAQEKKTLMDLGMERRADIGCKLASPLLALRTCKRPVARSMSQRSATSGKQPR